MLSIYCRSNVVVEWLTLLLRIRDIQSSNLSPKTGLPNKDFRGSSQSLQENSGIVPQNMP
jgi:hypothetical protein